MSPLRRRLWLAALCVYAAIGLIDMAARLHEVKEAGEPIAPNIPVAFSAGMFWPADLIARFLLTR